MQYFCLDIGGTGTRGGLFSADGTILARAQSTGGALSLGAAQAEMSIRAVWDQICATLKTNAPDPSQIELFAGIAGYGLPGRAAELGGRLAEFSKTVFVSDGYGALLAATNGQPGVLISVGTGVIALELDDHGKCNNRSGWGFPAGDQGSGAWLGLRVTGLLTQYLDGIALTPPMPDDFAKVAMQIAGHTAEEIMAWHTSAKPREYGALAPLIVKYAEDGSLFAQNLLSEAALEIVALARAYKTPQLNKIFLAGGLGKVLQPYCKNLAPDLTWQVSTSDALTGIYLLASGQAPIEQLSTRPGFS